MQVLIKRKDYREAERFYKRSICGAWRHPIYEARPHGFQEEKEEATAPGSDSRH